jgi:glycosyltransferase involved in cell wall biosynthesis
MGVKARIAPLKQRLLPSAVRERRYVIHEARSKITQARKVQLMRRFEDREVARLSSELQAIPPASVVTIIATYRRPELLPRAIQSALAQSVRDHVVVVVDDGGGLPDLPADPRLVAFSLQHNSGIAGVVRNVGIRLSRSEYVAFLDDDNEWEKNHLEVALEALQEDAQGERPDVVYTAVERVFTDGRVLDVLSTQFDRKLLAGNAYIDTSSLVIRRFPELHFSRLLRTRLGIAEDWELMFRLSRHMRIVHVPVKTVRYLVNPDSYFSMLG